MCSYSRVLEVFQVGEDVHGLVFRQFSHDLLRAVLDEVLEHEEGLRRPRERASARQWREREREGKGGSTLYAQRHCLGLRHAEAMRSTRTPMTSRNFSSLWPDSAAILARSFPSERWSEGKARQRRKVSRDAKRWPCRADDGRYLRGPQGSEFVASSTMTSKSVMSSATCEKENVRR